MKSCQEKNRKASFSRQKRKKWLWAIYNICYQKHLALCPKVHLQWTSHWPKWLNCLISLHLLVLSFGLIYSSGPYDQNLWNQLFFWLFPLYLAVLRNFLFCLKTSRIHSSRICLIRSITVIKEICQWPRFSQLKTKQERTSPTEV